MPIQIIALLAIGTILALIWLILLYISYNKYTEYVEPIDKKENMFKEFYCIGFYLIDIFKIKLNTKFDRKRKLQCGVVFSQKYSEYYYRCNVAAKATLMLTFFIPFIFISAILDQGIMIVVGFGVSGLSFWYFDMKITDIADKHEKEILKDIPTILSKLTLLINAGMIMNEAWVKVSETGKGPIYDEMKKVSQEIANGTSELDAFINFGVNCSVMEVRKFSSVLVQNLTKGNKELVNYLTEATNESWLNKKHEVKRQGEQA